MSVFNISFKTSIYCIPPVHDSELFCNDIQDLVAFSAVCPGNSWTLYYETLKANRPDPFRASVSEALGKGSN